MARRFTGSFERLKGILQAVGGVWHRQDSELCQLRLEDGAILNWFPSTGTVTFQGKPRAKALLQARVEAALASNSKTDPSDRDHSSLPTQEVDAVSSRTAAQSNAPPVHMTEPPPAFLSGAFRDAELVIGLVGAVGAQLQRVETILEDRLRVAGYAVQHVRISRDVIPQIVPETNRPSWPDEGDRIATFMSAGNRAREGSGNNAVLALGAAAVINARRSTSTDQPPARQAFIISSLKHPSEVAMLRVIYPLGFYLVGVYEDEKRRHRFLTKDKRIPDAKADELMERDADEHLEHGQRVTATFHLSDFFVRADGHDDQLKNSVWRIIDIMFGDPHQTPTFDEYAMYLAFAASLRSADLSRQVGAVIAKDREILATGANDCPRAGGGLYWPAFDEEQRRVVDESGGRDYMRGEDPNKAEQRELIDELVKLAEEVGIGAEQLRSPFEKSRIRDLTEFGRAVHAEMEALLACARTQVGTRDSVLYCTTFPCHNCAKHIVAAGVQRVVFVEPYQKSKAFELHPDAIQLGFVEDGSLQDRRRRVTFEPFVGVGPRRFFELFSMNLGASRPLKRKDSSGQALAWNLESSALRSQMLPCSYREVELLASTHFNQARKLVPLDKVEK